ncbi:hypothetical protein GO730_38485 [Spirosoma sp. HMF3257]|uniref:DUF3970 domain-containing protein n=1 Tax=Spirosoma telluris TaxID=2183553 RepID=A0A327NE59_9BACT|nr:hypothetical protein [Spirosoma telluris]RAI72993.1 hypothetical protein HMF3257_38405 [Spirosoma telluris]
MIHIRLEGDSAVEVKAVADTIESFFPQHITFTSIKPGTNPRYAGRQKFFSYARLEITTQPSPSDASE